MSRVLRHLLRRLVAAAAVVIAMITVTFLVYWLTPTEPAQFVYPYAKQLTPYQLETANRLLGTDRPLIVQYADYLWDLLHADFGTSWSGSRVTGDQTLDALEVGPRLLSAARLTASLVVGGAVLVLLLSIPLGALAARAHGRLVDRAVLFFTLLGICTHPMVIGLILRTVFADRLHWAPPTGYCPLFTSPAGADQTVLDWTRSTQDVCGGLGDWAAHLALPWLSFAFVFLALYTRITRASLLEELASDYVRTARAKGASETRVLARHALPNGALPLLTVLATEMGTALGIAVYVESAFGLPGLGRLSVNVLVGTLGLDLPVILGTVVLLSVGVVAGTVVVDVLQAVLDPRLATRPARTRRVGGLV